jgi:hypothetical protein
VALTPIKRSTVTASFRREAEKLESAESPLLFLTIEHPTISPPIRVVSNTVDIVLGGETYIGFLFDLSVLEDTDGTPEARLTIQNVDRKIGNAIRQLVTPPTVKIEVYPLSDFDTSVRPHVPLATPAASYTAENLRLIDITVDALQIEARIVSKDYTQRVYPGRQAIKAYLPALFR